MSDIRQSLLFLLTAQRVGAIFRLLDHVGLQELLHNHLGLLGRAELALALVQLALQLVDAGLLDGHGFFARTDFLLLLSELGIFRGDSL